MADRMPVVPVDRQRGTPIIIGDRRGEGVTDPPEGTGSRRGQETVRFASSGKREFSYNGSNAVLPVVVGGPLKIGGYLIAETQVGGNLYHHWAVCEGPLAISSITNVRLSGVAVAACKGTTEIHLGVAGDTTSTFMGAAIGGYTFPEGVAGVVIKYSWPDQTTPRFNPYEFTCEVTGWKAHDFSGGADAASTNPVRQAAQCLMNAAAGAGFSTAEFITAEWLAGQQACDFDIDPGAGTTKRWEISLRIDTQDYLESWVNKILEYACAHMRRDGEKYGLWLDLPRAVAQVGATDLVYTDEDTATLKANIGKPTVVWRARSEIPTVVTAQYTDKANGYVDASVQVPDAGPSGEWIETVLDRRGYMTREMARRAATYEFNLRQSELDITMEGWYDSALPLEGDRIRVRSRRLLPSTETVPNVAGAVAGEEHLVVEEQTWSPTSVQMRCSQYRDNQFSDTIDTSGGPNPPGTTPSTPAAPTSLVLTTLVEWQNGVPSVRIKVEWTPASEPYSSFTRVKYTRGGVTYVLGEFLSGPAFLEGALLGVQYDFSLTTVRVATGQESSALTGTITPTAIDVTVPDVTQALITPMGYFECYPPIGSALDLPSTGPSAAPSASAAAGGIVPTGSYLVAYSWVFPWGETAMSPTTLMTCTAGNQKISVTGILDGPTGVLFKKLYISNTDVIAPGAPMYVAVTIANGVTTDTENSVVAWVQTNNRAPALYDYANFINVYDNFGSPTSPPLAFSVPVSAPPITTNRLDVRKLIHADATTGLPRVDLLVRVVNTRGVQSAGNTYSNTTVGWPGGVPSGTGNPEQTLMAMPAFEGQTLTLANGDNNNVNLGGKHRQVVAGPTGAYAITGIAGGTAGQRITIINGVAQTLTIKHNSASSSTGNKIRVPGAANRAYANQYAGIDLEYHTDGFWYLIEA